MRDLASLPRQPAGVPFPTAEWPTGTAPGEVEGLVAALFSDDAEVGHTHAVAVVHQGRLVAERYGNWFVGELEALNGATPGPVGADDVHLSWSMAKSILHAVIGVLVWQG